LKRALQKKDIFDKFFCFGLIKCKYSNMELQALEIRNKKYNKIQRKYKKFLNELNYKNTENEDNTINENVWICWFQGLDNAPNIIKICINSIFKHLNDKKIHIITEKNYSDYVKIPEYIIKKWKQGVISYAHFSDILRTELLVEYGGLWVDATTYMTGEIPKIIYKEPLFLLEFKCREDITILKNSWFIYAQKNNRTLKIVRDLLYQYWLREKNLSEYFLWHFFVTMALRKYPEDYKKIVYINEEDSHLLLYNFFNQYSKEYWEQIKKNTSIHKVSYYKFFTEDTKMPKKVSNTYYDYFIKGKLD